jgi:hypothetical protein
MPERLALYTTIYPGAEPFLAEWYQSVLAQTDRDFDVWIGVDSLEANDVMTCLGAPPDAVRLVTTKGETPAGVRQCAVEHLVGEYPAVVFVDCDDLLYPSRVAAAREALRRHDVVGCALRIVDEQGRDLGLTFGPPVGENFDTLLPRCNVFGLSNTTYQSDVLRHCLPLPEGCELVDWLLVTRAWSAGSRLHFDNVPRMAYRQYSANVARVLLPFSSPQVMRATERVLGHYACVLRSGGELPYANRRALETAHARVELFHRAVTGSAATLESYIEALNRSVPQYVWWWSVAHPELEEIWNN